MKKIFLAIVVAMMASTGSAQMPKWMIEPVNDSIKVKVDNAILQTREGNKSSLWSMDGKLLYSTEYTILPFKNGVATLIDKSNNTIMGFVDMDGKMTALPGVQIAYSMPYFESDHLICWKEGNLTFYSKDGTEIEVPPYAKPYPMHRGYAPILTFVQPSKKKDPYFVYYTSYGPMHKYDMYINGETKNVDSKNIRFLSGIGSNGKGVAVIKDKLYWFNPNSDKFEPLLWGDEESEKRRHLSLDGDYEEYFSNLPVNGIEIQAKYGKKQKAVLRFDSHLLPEKFSFADEEIVFKDEPEAQGRYSSQLSAYGNGPYGIALDNKPVIPEQFESVGLTYGNRAMVKTDGKWGLIEILPDRTFSIRLNKGDDVAFRHQKFETQLRLDLPADISAKEARIEIPDSTGCIIDKTSRMTKDTESGNFVTYDCTLIIPDSLPDTSTSITYSPVEMSYDGFRMFDTPIAIKAWHLKSYNVDLIDSETSIADGTATFTINIQKDDVNSDFPFDVTIEADSVDVEFSKLSETRRKCIVQNLKEGDNNLSIIITEKGCPPSVFPFEIFYTKPKTKEKKQEEVVIRKKPESKKSESKKQTPRLEI